MDINIYDLKLKEIDRKIAALYNLKCKMLPVDQKCIITKQAALNASINERKILIAEMEKEQQYLKDQYILQQQQATKLAEQKVEQAKNISTQEYEKAQQELAKAKAAESLAKSVDTGNLEAGRILMGINTVSKYKTPLIIGAVTLTVLALGFVGYKMLAKAKKV